jgi:hypothetical protein
MDSLIHPNSPFELIEYMNAFKVPFDQLQSALAKKDKLKIELRSTFFTSKFADSLTSAKRIGYMTEVEEGSPYCRWEDEKGNAMPIHHMSSITLLQSLD